MQYQTTDIFKYKETAKTAKHLLMDVMKQVGSKTEHRVPHETRNIAPNPSVQKTMSVPAGQTFSSAVAKNSKLET